LRKQPRTGNGNLILRRHIQPQVPRNPDEFPCQGAAAHDHSNFVPLLPYGFDYVGVFTHQFRVDWRRDD
jgi:hypothetical protein